MAEGGRLVHTAGDRAVECGVRLVRVESRDEGRWTCNVGVVENKEVKQFDQLNCNILQFLTR